MRNPYGQLGVAVLYMFQDPVNALESRVMAVWANSLPLTTAPVFTSIRVLHRMIPLKSDVVPKVVCPATGQKTFLATAPPLNVTMAPFPTVRSCAI